MSKNTTVYNLYIVNNKDLPKTIKSLNDFVKSNSNTKEVLPTHEYLSKQQKEFASDFISGNNIIFRFNDLKEKMKKAFPEQKVSNQVLSAFLAFHGYEKVFLKNTSNSSLPFWKHKTIKV